MPQATSAFGGVGSSDPARRCPCDSGLAYDRCCGPLHRGESRAATPLALMRSRYAAFALRDEAYLLRTWHPRTRPAVSLTLDPRQQWTELAVLTPSDADPADNADPAASADTQGTVTYRASWRSRDGRRGSFVEEARFVRRGRAWVYLDGEVRE